LLASVFATSTKSTSPALDARKAGWISWASVVPTGTGGLGRALLLAGLHVLKEAGMESATLGVDAESLTGATRLYESVGFVEHKRYILYRRPL